MTEESSRSSTIKSSASSPVFNRWRLMLCFLAGLTAACSEPTPQLHATAPSRLSDWQLFTTNGDILSPAASTLVFRPASTLFSDYSQKLRSMWIPEGMQIRIADDSLQFPVGTILSKTFYYPSTDGITVERRNDERRENILLSDYRILETRLLVKRETDWEALPYVWNAEQTDAFLRIAGTSTELSLTDASQSQDFTYFVPNQNQCSACHQREHPDGSLEPLGARLEQLAGSFRADPDKSQLALLTERGWLVDAYDSVPAVDWTDQSSALEDRALAYLNMNCGHCHNPMGAADTSALILDGGHRSLTELGVCKPPVAAGGGAGNLRFGIEPGNAAASILLYRMQSSAPDEMMPELGRSLVHREGVELLGQWIEDLRVPECLNLPQSASR